MPPTPLVTAVVVTGKSPERKPLFAAAVRSFEQQTWANKELLVVNDSGERWLPPDSPHREVLVSPRKLGELRNVGLVEAAGSWIIQWDDDDFYHPDRIEFQMRHRRGENCAVMLRFQVRYSMRTRAAYVMRYKPSGIPGTILHPKTDKRYAALSKHEDSAFADHAFKVGAVVVQNMTRPELYLRFAHGNNTWSHTHIMRQYARRPGQQVLPPAASTYLRHVLLHEYGVAQ